MINVLILDNNVTMHKLFKKYFTILFKDINFNLYFAINNKEFNEYINNDIDIIIFEENIDGDVNGIKTVLGYADELTNLLFVTASNELEDIEFIRGKNIEILQKPFSPILFKDKINTFIKEMNL